MVAPNLIEPKYRARHPEPLSSCCRDHAVISADDAADGGIETVFVRQSPPQAEHLAHPGDLQSQHLVEKLRGG